MSFFLISLLVVLQICFLLIEILKVNLYPQQHHWRQQEFIVNLNSILQELREDPHLHTIVSIAVFLYSNVDATLLFYKLLGTFNPVLLSQTKTLNSTLSSKPP